VFFPFPRFYIAVAGSLDMLHFTMDFLSLYGFIFYYLTPFPGTAVFASAGSAELVWGDALSFS